MPQVTLSDTAEAPMTRMVAARAEALRQEEERERKRAHGRKLGKGKHKRNTAGLTSYKPGASGNPGGVPKVWVNVRDLARQYTETAVRVLVEVALDKNAAAGGRVAAAEAILDRGYGKPIQQIEQTVSVIDRLSDGDRAAVLQILDAVAAARPAVEGGQLEALPAPDATPDATPAEGSQT